MIIAIAAFATFAVAADPNYAVTVNVPEDAVEHQYRIVSLAWQDYFGAFDKLEVFYTIQSVPFEMNVKSVPRLNRFGRSVARRIQTENDRARYVGFVFEHVFREYTNFLLGVRKPITVHRNRVDLNGVYVNDGRTFFNRTITITFEDPPYGQSRVNRQVTNRNIPWTVWVDGSTNSIKLNPRYNMTEDLLYRYYHNVGHMLGYGHYLGTNDAATGKMLPPTQQFRSVMYADYKDLRFSTPVPLQGGVDIVGMNVIHRNWGRLIEDNVKRFNAQKLAPALETVLIAAARNAG